MNLRALGLGRRFLLLKCPSETDVMILFFHISGLESKNKEDVSRNDRSLLHAFLQLCRTSNPTYQIRWNFSLHFVIAE